MSNPQLKTPSSRVIWFVPLFISSIGGVVSVTRELKTIQEGDPIFWKIFYIVLLVLLGVVILFCLLLFIAYKSISQRYQEWKYRRERIRSDFLLNHIKVSMEYVTDDGELVSMIRTEHITNIKSTKTLSTVVESEGEIIEPSGINSSFTTLTAGRIRVYGLLNLTQIESGGEYYSTYSVTIKNGFLNKEEFWIFGVSNFCKFYEFELIIPSSRQVVNAKLLFKKVPEDEVKNSPYDIDLAQKDWQDDDTTSLMRVRKHSCTIIKVHISSLKENHRYKLVWVLN